SVKMSIPSKFDETIREITVKNKLDPQKLTIFDFNKVTNFYVNNALKDLDLLLFYGLCDNWALDFLSTNKNEHLNKAIQKYFSNYSGIKKKEIVGFAFGRVSGFNENDKLHVVLKIQGQVQSLIDNTNLSNLIKEAKNLNQ
ncbi:23669_t:CDS:1, partial [Gigaspora margarita]